MNDFSDGGDPAALGHGFENLEMAACGDEYLQGVRPGNGDELAFPQSNEWLAETWL